MGMRFALDNPRKANTRTTLNPHSKSHPPEISPQSYAVAISDRFWICVKGVADSR